jgi:hypothetical protein
MRNWEKILKLNKDSSLQERAEAAMELKSFVESVKKDVESPALFGNAVHEIQEEADKLDRYVNVRTRLDNSREIDAYIKIKIINQLSNDLFKMIKEFAFIRDTFREFVCTFNVSKYNENQKSLVDTVFLRLNMLENFTLDTANLLYELSYVEPKKRNYDDYYNMTSIIKDQKEAGVEGDIPQETIEFRQYNKKIMDKIEALKTNDPFTKN